MSIDVRVSRVFSSVAGTDRGGDDRGGGCQLLKLLDALRV